MLRLEQWELAMFRGEARRAARSHRGTGARCGGSKTTVILIYRAHLA